MPMNKDEQEGMINNGSGGGLVSGVASRSTYVISVIVDTIGPRLFLFHDFHFEAIQGLSKEASHSRIRGTQKTTGNDRLLKDRLPPLVEVVLFCYFATGSKRGLTFSLPAQLYLRCADNGH